jgi:hypothetical protein
MLETCRGHEFLINWIESASRWFHCTDVLWCTVKQNIKCYIAVSLLCWQLQQQIEKALTDLHIGVPAPRIGTEGMITDEPTRPKARMPRDRRVLNRYGNYLRQWVRRWDAGVTRCRRMRRKCWVSNAILQIRQGWRRRNKRALRHFPFSWHTARLEH